MVLVEEWQRGGVEVVCLNRALGRSPDGSFSVRLASPNIDNAERPSMAAIQAAAGSDVSFEVAEKQVLGADHAEIGAHILSRWSFPEDLVHAVRWHHAPDGAGSPSRTTDVVHVANVLCLMRGIGVGRAGLQYEPSPDVTRRLGLNPLHLERVASQTLQWVDELSDVFATE